MFLKSSERHVSPIKSGGLNLRTESPRFIGTYVHLRIDLPRAIGTYVYLRMDLPRAIGTYVYLRTDALLLLVTLALWTPWAASVR